jgi:hypothetical protein
MGTTTISAVHVTDLRTALQEAYSAAGMTLPTYADPELTSGVTLARAAHIAELRNAVIAIE